MTLVGDCSESTVQMETAYDVWLTGKKSTFAQKAPLMRSSRFMRQLGAFYSQFSKHSLVCPSALPLMLEPYKGQTVQSPA